jgi:uncharacterized membrane protein YfhO
MWGIAYIVADKPDPAYGPDIFTGASGLKVYRRPDAFPRVWSVHELISVPDRGQSNVQIGREPEAFRNRKATIFGTAPRVEACDSAADRVELAEHHSDRLLIRASMACDGMVVLSDAWFPGWRARLDQKLTPIYEVDGAMRGVLVPKGNHTITMRYRPKSVILGGALTLLGIVLALAFDIYGRKRR